MGRLVALTPVALAACAGAVDLLALAGLHGAFASVITGNLVATGYGVGTGNAAVAWPPIVAVVAYAVGVAAWQWVWRARPSALVGPLAAELAVIVVVAAGWWSVGGEPARAGALALLGLAAFAMGGQSVAAMRLHASTTYLTGTLTAAVHDLVTGEPGDRWPAVRQLAALAVGAALAAVVLSRARWAVPLLPVAILAAVVVGRLADRAPAAR